MHMYCATFAVDKNAVECCSHGGRVGVGGRYSRYFGTVLYACIQYMEGRAVSEA